MVFKHGIAYVFDVVGAMVYFVHFFGVFIEPDGFNAGLGKANGQGEAYVSKSDNAYHFGVGGYFF